MKQHQTSVANPYKPIFRIIRGLKNEEHDLDKLVNTAWNFAYTALWNTVVLSKSEISTAKAIIREYLLSSKTPLKAYKSFCQRVLLARQYVSSQPGRYIPIPSIWLDKKNETGFAGTKEWYRNILAVRRSLPNYKTELKAFSEAILEMTEDPSAQNFIYWRNYFIEKRVPGLLTLFLSTVANEQFGVL